MQSGKRSLWSDMDNAKTAFNQITGALKQAGELDICKALKGEWVRLSMQLDHRLRPALMPDTDEARLAAIQNASTSFLDQLTAATEALTRRGVLTDELAQHIKDCRQAVSAHKNDTLIDGLEYKPSPSL